MTHLRLHWIKSKTNYNKHSDGQPTTDVFQLHHKHTQSKQQQTNKHNLSTAMYQTSLTVFSHNVRNTPKRYNPIFFGAIQARKGWTTLFKKSSDTFQESSADLSPLPLESASDAKLLSACSSGQVEQGERKGGCCTWNLNSSFEKLVLRVLFFLPVWILFDLVVLPPPLSSFHLLALAGLFR